MKQLIVGFGGLPNSGKTFTADGLFRLLTENGVSTLFLKDAAANLPLLANRTDPFVFSSCAAYATLSGLYLAMQQNIQVILVERDINDHAAFFEALGSAGEIPDKERVRNTIKGLREHVRFLNEHEDIVNFTILLEITAQTSQARDHGGENVPFGRMTRPDFLSHLVEAYKRMKAKLSSSELKVVDGEQEQNAVRQAVFGIVYGTMRETGLFKRRIPAFEKTLIPNPKPNGRPTGGDEGAAIENAPRETNGQAQAVAGLGGKK